VLPLGGAHDIQQIKTSLINEITVGFKKVLNNIDDTDIRGLG
jgi:hypothetical protein